MTNTLKIRIIELLQQDDKREYLELCQKNYTQAVSIIVELFPEYYNMGDPFDRLYEKAMEKKKQGDTDEEIQILKTAIDNHSKIPYCYERLAILYSKAKNYKLAYDVCSKWFDSGFWKIPNCVNTSLQLLNRLEKLKLKI